MMRKIALGLVLGMTLVAPLAACGSDSSDADAAASPTVNPTEVVAAAVAKTVATSFSLAVSDGITTDAVTGSYDATNKIASFSQAVDAETLTMVITADSMYLSGLSSYQGLSVKLLLSKMPSGAYVDIYSEATFPLMLLSGATTTTSAGDGTYEGTLDLAKVQATTAMGTLCLATATTAAADKASSIAYTATVDADGYVSKVSMTLPGMAEGGADLLYETTFSGFGAAVTITLPTADTILDAPEDVYAEFAS